MSMSQLITQTIDFNESTEDFLLSLNNLPSSSSGTDNNCDIIKIQKCLTVSSASAFISEEANRINIFEKFPSIIAIRFQIECKTEEFNQEHAEKPKKYEYKSREKFLISFEESKRKQKVIYWKNSTDGKFLTLKFDDQQYIASVSSYVVEFIVYSLKFGRQVFFSNFYNQLTGLIDSRGYNLLMTAVENENIEILRELLKLPFNINQKTNKDETAADIAWKINNQEILLKLLKANSAYPKKFNEDECSDEIKEFLEISNKMHKAIENNDQETVKQIIKANKTLRHFYNKFNVSAATAAINKEEIYELFINNNCCIGKFENTAELMSQLDDDRQRFLRQIHKKNFKNLPQKHIQVHLMNSNFGHDDEDIGERLQVIRDSFDRIDKIPEGQMLLKINATCQKVSNNFDFNRNSLELMVPTQDSRTSGVYFFIEEIYFAAQKLLKDDEKYEVDGVMMHEHGHCAIDKVFRNDAEPYAKDDIINERKFKALISEFFGYWIENKDKIEPIVEWVYECYEEDVWAAELIVRVPHILGHYQNQYGKLKELKETFKSLFDYYDQIVMPAMEAALPVLEKLQKDTSEITFDELTEPLKSAILHSWVEFQGVEVRLKEIANKEVLKLLNSKQIRQIFKRKILSIGKKPIELNETYVERDFIDYDFKNKITEFSLKTGKLEFTSEAKQNLKCSNSIIDEVSERKLFLLADYAGAGKSTTMKKFCIETKEKFDDHFVTNIDLKQHLEVYEKFKNELSASNVNIDKISTKFEEIKRMKIVIEILKEIFFDGLDEIAPKYETFIITLIKEIKRLTKNQQWIATRPQHIEKLKTEFEHKAYKLLPLDEAKTKEFIQTFAQTQNIDESLLAKINEITEILNFVDNPLMLKMIVELYKNGKLKAESFNRFSLYDLMFESKREILAGEKGKMANLDSTRETETSVWKVYQIYALKTIFTSEIFEDFLTIHESEKKSIFIKFDETQIFKLWNEDKENWTADAIARSGFLTVHNWKAENESPEFVHRTFAEHFVAKYIIESVKKAIEGKKSTEFDLTTKSAAFITKEFCETPNYDEGIYGFILDYLSSINLHEVKIGEQFLKLLLTKEVKNFITEIINNEKWFTTQKMTKIVIAVLKLLNVSDLKYLNNLTLLKNETSHLFQKVFRNYNSATEAIELFEIFKATKLPNWYQMTGYGKYIKCQKINEIYQSVTEENKTIQQMFWFIANANDIPVEDVQIFLFDFSKKISIFNFDIQLLTDITEKYFSVSKQKFSKIVKNCFQRLFSDISKLFELDQILQNNENLFKYFELVNNFFNSEPILKNEVSEKIQKFFHSSGHQNLKFNCFQILFVFSEDFDKITEAINILKKLYKNNWLNQIGYPLTIEHNCKISSNKAEDIYNLLCLDIPFDHLKYFFNNHCSKIEYLTYEFDNFALGDKLFELIKLLYSKNMNEFYEIIWISMENLQNIMKYTNTKIFNYLKKNFCLLLKVDILEVKDFDYNQFEIHPLFKAIKLKNEIMINSYKKLFNSEEILRIFYNYFDKVLYMFDDESKNYVNFFNAVFNVKLDDESLEEIVLNEDNKDFLLPLIQRFCKLFYPFLNLIVNINCSLSDLQNFLNKKPYFFLYFAFHCRSIIDKIFEIFEKYFKNEKAKIAEWIKKGIDTNDIFNINNVNIRHKINVTKSNIEYFLSKVEQYFVSDVEMIQKIFLSEYIFNHPLVIAIYYEIDFFKDFYFKYFKPKDILKNLVLNLNSISCYFDNKSFEHFFNEHFLSNDKRRITIEIFFRHFNDEFLSIIDEKLIKISDDLYIKQERKEKNSFDFLNFLVDLSDSHNVSIFKSFCFKSFENLSSGKEFLKYSNNTQVFFEFAFKNDVKILNEIFDAKIYYEKKPITAVSIKLFAFDIFYYKLVEHSTVDDSEWIRNFLLIECEPNQIHPLIVALCNNFSHVTELYQKYLSKEEILKIFLNHIRRFIIFPIRYKNNFKNFFTSVFEVNFVDESQDKFLILTKNDEEYIERFDRSQIHFYFLNLLLRIDCSNLLNDLENFFFNQLHFVLYYALLCRAAIDEMFEIFEKYFKNEKMRVFEWFKFAFDNIDLIKFNSKQNADAYISNFEYFWMKIEKISYKNVELMRKILLNDYEWNHPLVIGIYYEIDFLKDFYFKHFERKEILENLILNIKSISKYFNEELFELFFKQNFIFITTKEFIITNFFKFVKNADEKLLFGKIDERILTLTGDTDDSFETKFKNSLSFLNFLLKMIESLNVSIFKEFCLKQSESISSKAKELSGFSSKTQVFFEFAFQNDVKILNEILNLKFFEKDRAKFSKYVAHHFFYRKLFEHLTELSSDWIRNFLLIECEPQQVHPLIIALCNNFDHITDLHLKYLFKEEILKIFFYHFYQISLFIILSVENFKIFCASVFKENFVDESQGEFLYPKNNEQMLKITKNRSQILFYFLSLLLRIDCSNVLNDFEYFLSYHFQIILFYGFHCRSIIDKIFKIFEKYFQNQKSMVTECIKKGLDLTVFFNPNYKETVAVCVSNIEYFWTMVEELFISEPEVMKNIFLSDYKFNHPLVIGIYYEIDFLKDLYFNLFDMNEILRYFFFKIEPISRFYDENSFEKYFKNYFLSNEEQKKNFVAFLNKNLIFDKIKNEKENIADDFYVSKEIKIANLEKFSNLLERAKAEKFE